MAIRTWTLGNGSSATGNWSSPADWSPKAVPAPNDSVLINGNNVGNYTVTLDTSQPASGSYTALTVGIANATLALSVAGDTLSVSGLTTLSAGNINISNTATLATGTLLVTSVGNFVQGNGLLSVTGTGPAALSVTGGTFGLSGGAVAVTNGASFANGTGTISGGTFTAATIAVAGGAVTQSGGTITSSGAMTLSTGSIAVTKAAATLNAASLTVSGDTFSQSNGTIAVTGLANFIAGTDTISGGVFNAGTLTLGKDTAVSRTLTLSGGVTTISGTTTISAATAVGGSKVVMSGGSLAALGGISFSGLGNRGTLTGNGTVSGGAISNAGTIVAIGGTLDIGNAINSGPILTIGTTANSDLKLDGVATSASAITINNTNQTLEVGATGALTIGAAQSVASGNILMDGGTITDAAGISFGAAAGVIGTLSGFGTVAANLTKVVGAGANIITASGGTLDLTGTFGTGLVAAIGTASASDLRFDSTSTVAALSINNGFQTLEAHSGVLTLTGAQTVSLGKILLSGGTLGDSAGIILGANQNAGTLTGFGTVTAAITEAVSTGSLVVASGGTLILGAGIGANSGLSYQIAAATPSVLELDGSVGGGNTFTFLGAAGDLAYNNAGGISENIVGLNVGTSATPTNFIDYMNHTVTISNSSAHSGNSGTVNLSDGSVLTLSGVTNAPGAWFVNTKADGVGTDIFLSSVCYAAGTGILTATGERMVESLMQGDIVLTLAGGELNAQPVKWIGRRRIDLAAHPRPETVAPIRIARDAFADNMPHSDLLLSPDHAVFVDGKLICARQLVNGTTIRQEKGRASVEYFHVELDAHAILLAEGLPAESYLSTGNRGFFANSGEPLMLHPDLTDETDYPARQAASCAPFAWDEGSVLPVWQRLAERAAALGQPATQLETTGDPELQIVARGRTVRPMYGEDGLYIFALPKGATEVRLVSRAGSPADARPWLDDRRCLGVNVERIVLRGASELQEVPVDHPDLSQGWQAVDRDGTSLHRWTSGDAVLPLPALGGPAMLEIRAGNGGMAYITTADEECRVT